MSDVADPETLEKYFIPLTLGVLVDQLSRIGDDARSAKVCINTGSKTIPLSCCSFGVLAGGVFTIEPRQLIVKMGPEIPV